MPARFGPCFPALAGYCPASAMQTPPPGPQKRVLCQNAARRAPKFYETPQRARREALRRARRKTFLQPSEGLEPFGRPSSPLGRPSLKHDKAFTPLSRSHAAQSLKRREHAPPKRSSWFAQTIFRKKKFRTRNSTPILSYLYPYKPHKPYKTNELSFSTIELIFCSFSLPRPHLELMLCALCKVCTAAVEVVGVFFISTNH